MIKVNFIEQNDLLVGFELRGHAASSKSGDDVVCAFVSSACYMCANTITDVLHIEAQLEVEDGYMLCTISPSDAPAAQTTLKGLVLHLTALAGDYPKNITVI